MSFPTPEISELDRPYWDALEQGVVRYQHCRRCHANWLPARAHCPQCLSGESIWETASGHGHVVSLVVFHIAYHEAFKERVPYNVAVVELAEGPRLLTNIVGPSGEVDPWIGAPVDLVVEREEGQSLARFTLTAT